MPNFLILIGTVHRDPHGYKKLCRFLEEKKPEIITVEVSPYSRAFRARQSAELRQILRRNLRQIQREEGLAWQKIFSHGAIIGIFCLLQDPFEWRAAEVYFRKNGASLFDIDLSSYAQEKLAKIPELISIENLRTLVHLPSPPFYEEISSQYLRARYLLQHPPLIWPVEKETIERELVMAEKIRQLLANKKGKMLCHIGGWEHLIERPNEKSLFSLLQDFKPIRILLPP